MFMLLILIIFGVYSFIQAFVLTILMCGYIPLIKLYVNDNYKKPNIVFNNFKNKIETLEKEIAKTQEGVTCLDEFIDNL